MYWHLRRDKDANIGKLHRTQHDDRMASHRGAPTEKPLKTRSVFATKTGKKNENRGEPLARARLPRRTSCVLCSFAFVTLAGFVFAAAETARDSFTHTPLGTFVSRTQRMHPGELSDAAESAVRRDVGSFPHELRPSTVTRGVMAWALEALNSASAE